MRRNLFILLSCAAMLLAMTACKGRGDAPESAPPEPPESMASDPLPEPPEPPVDEPESLIDAPNPEDEAHGTDAPKEPEGTTNPRFQPVDYPGEYGPRLDLAPADLTDLEAVTRAYLGPLPAGGSLMWANWATAGEIEPDHLITFYSYNNMGNLPIYRSPDGYTYDDGYARPTAPADELEAALMRHFDVTPEHLRRAEAYDPGTHSYALYDGFNGGGYYPVALAASERDGIIRITVGLSGITSEETTVAGELTLRLDAGDVVHYLSYRMAQ